MGRNRKTYSESFKKEVAVEALKEKTPVAEIATAYGISPSLVRLLLSTCHIFCRRIRWSSLIRLLLCIWSSQRAQRSPNKSGSFASNSFNACVKGLVW